ncbi:restriction endonuclease [Streptomyces anulatus]
MVAALLRRDGFNVLQRHGGAGDRGADVIAVAPTGEKLVAQCKLVTAARRVEVGVLYAWYHQQTKNLLALCAGG